MIKNETLAYIYEWCLVNNIKATVYGGSGNTFLAVDKTIYFYGTQYYKNSATGVFTAWDKKSTEIFLQSSGFKILPQENFIFRGRGRIECIIKAVEYAKAIGFPLVVKPNDSSLGTDVFKVENAEEFDKKMEFFDMIYGHINISKFIDLRSEYRFYVYKNNVEIAYRKTLSTVVGDGEKTLYDLLLAQQIKDIKELIQDNFAKGFSLQDIIPKGRKVVLGWKFRLDNQGSLFELLEPENLDEKLGILKKDAEEISRLMNLDLCAVDFYETIGGEFLVNEVNSGFMIENFIKYGPRNKDKVDTLLKKIFKETK